jgi:putative flavoprotein involved in K+ transport
MPRTDVLIIGAGQAGLAMSRCLAACGIEHVVLERGRVGESWRRLWESLTLLTPNWMTRLPGHSYAGRDPDGFMGRAEVVALLERYARCGGAPVVGGTRVRAVRAEAAGYRVETDRGASGAWSGRPATAATTAGCRCRCSIKAARSSTTAA